MGVSPPCGQKRAPRSVHVNQGVLADDTILKVAAVQYAPAHHRQSPTVAMDTFCPPVLFEHDAAGFYTPELQWQPPPEELLELAESMLLESYARGESTEAWWSRFSAFYLGLRLDAATRCRFANRLGWLFCRYGETGWTRLKPELDARRQGCAGGGSPG